MKLERGWDAIGRAMYDHYRGEKSFEIVERDDGYIAPSAGPAIYFSEPADWPSSERRALRLVRSRILDIGCGAGRHALYLQERGHDVVGIDNSPLAIKTANLRGVRDARALPVTRIASTTLGTFDSVLLLGNNFGLVANPKRAHWLLRRLWGMTSSRARILAASNDFHQARDSAHRAYRRRNRRRGLMPGQLRMRVRYRDFATPWFDFLQASPKEMERIIAGTGWAARRHLDGPAASYVAVLEKAGAPASSEESG